MTKKEARLYYGQRQFDISMTEREKALHSIYKRFVDISFSLDGYFLSYCAIESKAEIAMSRFEQHLLSAGMRKALPRVNGTSFDAIAIDSVTEYKKHIPFGMLEPIEGEVVHPSELSVVLTPSIIFDMSGCRVGYGRGMYDRFMTRLRSTCDKVAFSFFHPLLRVKDRQLHDVLLSVGITPNGTYWFN